MQNGVFFSGRICNIRPLKFWFVRVLFKWKNITFTIVSYRSSYQLKTYKVPAPSDRIFWLCYLNQVRGFDVEFLCCLLISPFAPDCVLQALLGHTDTVTCLTASLAYHIIVSGSRDRTCIIWDLNKLSFLTQLRGHRAPISALCINELTVRAKPCTTGCSGNSSKSLKSLNQRENKC